MSAPLGTASNLKTNIHDFGFNTLSYGGYLTSGGNAYNIVLPFQADQFEWWRYTAYGSAGTIASGVWLRDMPAGANLEIQAIADNGVTGKLDTVLETTNGITINNVLATFPNEHAVITGISIATPGVVTTSANHGYVSGQRVVITKVVGSVGQYVNDQTFVVKVLSATTFGLYDVYGAPVPTLGTYTSGGQSTLTGPDLAIQNAPTKYQLTLGTAVMGSASDVIYFRATKMNSYYNLGTTP
jgi:hypothetical protein